MKHWMRYLSNRSFWSIGAAVVLGIVTPVRRRESAQRDRPAGRGGRRYVADQPGRNRDLESRHGRRAVETIGPRQPKHVTAPSGRAGEARP